MRAAWRRLGFAWLGMLLCLGLTQLVARLPLAGEWRTLVLGPPMLMVSITAVVFMRVQRGPIIVRGFALAALFWLTILLGLGALDPLTRTDYAVPGPAAR